VSAPRSAALGAAAGGRSRAEAAEGAPVRTAPIVSCNFIIVLEICCIGFCTVALGHGLCSEERFVRGARLDP
jgi:hypothetical protein